MHKFGIIMSAILFTGCTFEADGHVRPGWPDQDHGHSHDDGGHYYDTPSGVYIYDTFAECWAMEDPWNKPTYGWYFEAIVEESSGHYELIDEVWIDVYDGAGLLFSELLFDAVDYGAWLQPPAAAPFEYRSGYEDGVFMYAAMQENMNSGLDCNSNHVYDVYTTVYDVYGDYQTTVDSL